MSSKYNVISNCCKYKLLEISRLLSRADLQTRQLSGTHLFGNTSKIVPARKLLECSRTLCEYIYIYIYICIKTHLCSNRGSSCCCRSDDCFESYTERELLQKIAHFKELWRQQ